MVRLPIFKKWISNLLTFYSESPKNTSLNEKNIERLHHEEKIIKTEEGILSVKSANEDNITFDLCDLNVTLTRFISIDVPHEVSIYVPRAEIRKTLRTGNDKEYTSEVILNSITIVHSPNINKTEKGKIGTIATEESKEKIKDKTGEPEDKATEINKPKPQIGFKFLL